MTVDSYILWEISDPLKFYRTLGNTTEAESRLDAVTYNALKTLMGQHQQTDIINQDDAAERNDIFVGLTDEIAKLCEAYGIKVLDVRIKRFDLAQSNEESVYLRMISERKKEAAQYTSEGEYEAAKTRNAADKDANTAIADAKLAAATLEAEGEAEYMEIISGIYDTESKREFYEFTLSLDALAATLDGNNKTVIIDKNSTIGKLLLEPGEPIADITDEDMPSDTADNTENNVAEDPGVESDGETDAADSDANESEDVETAA